MKSPTIIRPKERDAILQSLRAGVVPRIGHQHIQVGRTAEISAVIKDIDRIADGGSAFRFIIGEYGSGKTFFLSLVRAIALEKKLVASNADLTPDRRLQASNGQARSLYAELMRNLSTRAKPEGGALPSIVEKFVSHAVQEAKDEGISPEISIRKRLASLNEMVNGFDFADVIAAYWSGHNSGNETLMSDAIKWLRGEFTTRTDARNALGVRTFVDDTNLYDQIKLMARFTRLAGYSGLLLCLDELVNLYKLNNSQARSGNYEQILRMLNDGLQGSAEGCGFLLGGTPEFLMDPRKGLYSYQALASRLEENQFATGGLVDFSGPVLRLSNLTQEDLFLLLQKLRNVFFSGDPKVSEIPDDALMQFMLHCRRRIGEAYFRTPRTTIRSFINLLSILEQNPEVEWNDIIESIDVQADRSTDEDEPDDDELAALRLD